MGIPRDCPIFSGTPYYLRNRKSYGFQILPVHLEGPPEQKPIKNFGEKGVLAYPGTSQIFWVPPIITGKGKATDFKFGQYIHSVHPNKSPLKIFEKREHGRIQGLLIFFSGTGKATNFKFGRYIQRVHPNKSARKILEKRKLGRIQGLHNFLGTPYYLWDGKSHPQKCFCFTHIHDIIGGTLKLWAALDTPTLPFVQHFNGFLFGWTL